MKGNRVAATCLISALCFVCSAGATEPPAPAATSDASAAPSNVSVRASVGLGGGGQGVMGRLGLQLDLWARRYMGIGASIVYANQSGLLGGGMHYVLVAPVLSLRGSADSGGAFAAFGPGFMVAQQEDSSGFLCDSSCSSPASRDATGVALTGSVGYLGRAGALEIGVGLTLDALNTGLERDWELGIAVNFLLGVAIPEHSPGDSSARPRGRPFR